MLKKPPHVPSRPLPEPPLRIGKRHDPDEAFGKPPVSPARRDDARPDPRRDAAGTRAPGDAAEPPPSPGSAAVAAAAS